MKAVEIAVAAWGPNRLDMFGIGTDSAMYHKAWNGAEWEAAWDDLGGTFTSPPAVAAWGPNRLDVFGIGTDSAMYHKAWNGAEWEAAWDDLGGTFISTSLTYEFSIPQLNISNMRTGHFSLKDGSDTDYAYLGVQVKGQPAQTSTVSLGDHSGGVVQVGLHADVVATDTDLVTFQYSVINSSNGPAAATAFLEKIGSELLSAVEKADETAVTKLTGIPLSGLSSQEAGALIGAQLGNIVIPGLGSIIGAVAGWFSTTIADWGWPDCDGPVAIGLRVFSGAQLRGMIQANDGAGTSGVDDNPGTNSADGCGSNSDYQVSWSITAASS